MREWWPKLPAVGAFVKEIAAAQRLHEVQGSVVLGPPGNIPGYSPPGYGCGASKRGF
jgi:hypothetical protein